ncbi:hypothetical protein BVX97_02080 [bacterium E08(2017)]|nr:hypothetical protein BVX97_02080 [bacterium E08(2017)]
MAKKRVTKEKSKKSSILVVDDHPIVRYGVARVISQDPELTVIGEAESPDEALVCLKKKDIDLAVVDISLEGVLDGLTLTKTIRNDYPNLPVLILSMHDEMTYAQKALSSGANGYIMKEESSEKLITAIKTLLKGDVYVSEPVKQQMINSFSKPKDNTDRSIIEVLSERECQVFALIGTGHTTRSIADKLHVSVKTVETHRSRIKFKLNISSTPELVLAAAAWAKDQRIAPVY